MVGDVYKVCSECNELKIISEYYKDSNKKDGYRNNCKNCHNQHIKLKPEINRKASAQWRKKHPEKVQQYSEEYYHNNIEKIKEASAAWRKENIDKIKEREREWRQQHPEICKQRSKEYYLKNSKKINAKKALWEKNNKEKKSEHDKRTRQRNPDKTREKDLRARKNYKKNHPDYEKNKFQKEKDELSDNYILKMVCRDYNLKRKNVPEEYIESKRMQIKVKRLLKSKKDENTETC